MRIFSPAIIALACAVLGGAAFAADESHAPKIDACALLKDGEVAGIVGAKVTPADRRDAGYQDDGTYVAPGTYSSTCLWRVATSGPPPADPNLSLGGASYVILNAMQWPPSSKLASKESCRFVKGFYDAADRKLIDNQPVPLKIADQSLWWGDGVAVCKGDRSFGISVHLVGGRPKERDMEERLAKMIAGRM